MRKHKTYENLKESECLKQNITERQAFLKDKFLFVGHLIELVMQCTKILQNKNSAHIAMVNI